MTIDRGPCDYCHAQGRVYRVGEEFVCADCREDVLYCERKGKEREEP